MYLCGEVDQPATIYKDLDFIEMHGKIMLGAQRSQAVYTVIRLTYAFIRSHRVCLHTYALIAFASIRPHICPSASALSPPES